MSPEFRVLKVGLGKNEGSDHFPFYTDLAFEPMAASEQKLPEPSKDVVDDAIEQIREEHKEDSANN